MLSRHLRFLSCPSGGSAAACGARRCACACLGAAAARPAVLRSMVSESGDPRGLRGAWSKTTAGSSSCGLRLRAECGRGRHSAWRAGAASQERGAKRARTAQARLPACPARDETRIGLVYGRPSEHRGQRAVRLSTLANRPRTSSGRGRGREQLELAALGFQGWRRSTRPVSRVATAAEAPAQTTSTRANQRVPRPIRAAGCPQPWDVPCGPGLRARAWRTVLVAPAARRNAGLRGRLYGARESRARASPGSASSILRAERHASPMLWLCATAATQVAPAHRTWLAPAAHLMSGADAVPDDPQRAPLFRTKHGAEPPLQQPQARGPKRAHGAPPSWTLGPLTTHHTGCGYPRSGSW
jgi:hypothetical protein